MFKFRNKYVKPRGSGCGCNRPRGSGVYTGGAGAAELQQVDRALQQQEALRFPLTNATPELLAERQAVNQPISRGTPPFELPMIPQQEPGPSYTGPLRMTATANAAGGVQLTGAVETVPPEEFYLDENSVWRPKSYRAAVELLGIAMGGMKDALDLAEHVVNGDGVQARLVELSAFAPALRNAFGSMDVAYDHAEYAAEAAGSKEDALRPLLAAMDGAMQQIERIPGLVQRANNRARVEGYQEGYFNGWNDSLKKRNRSWERLFDTIDKAVGEAGKTSRHLADRARDVAGEASKAAPWLAIIAAAVAAVVLAADRRKSRTT